MEKIINNTKKVEEIYVVGTMKEVLTINDLRTAGIETFDNEAMLEICGKKKYSVYVKDGEVYRLIKTL